MSWLLLDLIQAEIMLIKNYVINLKEVILVVYCAGLVLTGYEHHFTFPYGVCSVHYVNEMYILIWLSM